MAIHSGTSGSVVYQTVNGTAGTLVGEIKNWTLTVEAEELDTSAFGQSWRGFDAGIKSGTAGYYGTVVILGEEVAQAFDAFGETSYNFRGDGTLAKK